MDTAFTRLVGCTIPLQQAGMGPVATNELAVAVAEAGGLGMLAMPGAPRADVVRALDEALSLTGGAIGMNFLMPFLDRDSLVDAATRARVVELFYGDPDAALVTTVHEGGALASWQVGSTDEARAAVDAGCDLVVVQGLEAGGHVRGELPLLQLLDDVLGAIDVPVVAAGGLGTAHAVAEALAAGAAAVRIGTRFVAAVEADAHPTYVDALIASEPDDTVVTTTFSVFWPDAPHRVLRSCIDAVDQVHDEVVGETVLPDGVPLPIGRCTPAPPQRTTTGHTDAMALYAGRSVGAVQRRATAAEIIRELTEGL
jgi:NAD(P)H-dependent flavin oxidoreductase YrpB (nitropropane dioxygenase family)